MIRALSELRPRDDRVTGLFAAVLAFSVGLTTVVSVIAAVAAYFLFTGPIGHPHLIAPALVYLAVFLVVMNTCWNLDGVFAAFRAGRELFWIRTQLAVCYLLLCVVARFFMSPSVWILIVALSVSWSLTLVTRTVLIRKWMKLIVPISEIRRGFDTLPEILWFGIKVTPGELADGLTAEAGTWILGVVSSIASVGAWNRAWGLGRRLFDLNHQIAEMLFPTLVERRASGDGLGFDRALLDSLRYVCAGALMPAAAAGGASVGVMELFGPGFSRGSAALAITLLAAPMMAMVLFETQALLAVDRPLRASSFSLARLGITLGASVPLAIAFGLTGPAIGIALGAVIQLVAQLLYLRRFLDGPISRYWPMRSVLAVVVSYAAAFVVARFVDSALPGIVGLLLALLGGFITYGSCFVATGGILPRDRKRLERVVRRVRGRTAAGGNDVGPPGVGADAEGLGRV